MVATEKDINTPQHDMRSVTRSMMSRPLPSHQKLAEKFVILNNRLDGMITRIYNIKKVIMISLICCMLDKYNIIWYVGIMSEE